MEVYGIDLAQWVAERRWAHLLDYIDELPPASRLREAIFNDPDEAAKILAEQVRAEEAALGRELAATRGLTRAQLHERLGLTDDPEPGDDEDVAAAPVWRPRQSEWDLAAIQRASIHAVLVSLSSKTPRPKGHRPPGPSDFFPAPRTLVDELREARERRDYASALAVFAPSARP